MPISNPIVNITITGGSGSSITVVNTDPITQAENEGDAVFNAATGGLFIADDILEFLPVKDTRQRLTFNTEIVGDSTVLTGIPLHVYGVASDEVLTPNNMTDNVTPSPFVASSSGITNTNYEYYAFDGNLESNYFIGCALDISSGFPVHLQIDLGDTYQISEYSLASYDTGTFESSNPKSWELQYSNDGSAWTTADTQTDFTGWNSGVDFSVPFTLSSPCVGRYWRVYITDESYPTSTYDQVIINEFSLTGSDPSATSNRLIQGTDFNISLNSNQYVLSILNSAYTLLKVEYLLLGE